MANTLQDTYNSIANVTEGLFKAFNKSQQSQSQPTIPLGKGKGQTCLESFAIEARKMHLLRNEWRKDLEYSKPLVVAEYEIQTEFKVGTTDDDLEIQKQKAEEKKAKADRKALEKKAKKEEKANRKANQVKGVSKEIDSQNMTEPKVVVKE